MVTCTVGHEGFTTFQGSQGVSLDAGELEAESQRWLRERARSAVFYQREEVYGSMRDILNECSEANWDGYGAKPVSLESLRAAAEFWALLPSSTPVPEVGPDPEGCYLFEWRVERARFLVIKVSPRKQLVYAGNLGDKFESKIRGSQFFSTHLPDTILSSLAKLFEPH